MSRILFKDRWKPRSLRVEERGDPKAGPLEQWEALEHKNELALWNAASGGPPLEDSTGQAYFCASRVPIFSSEPSKPLP